MSNRLNNLFQRILPPPEWRFVVLMVMSIFLGIFSYLIYISRAWSYVSDEPGTCVNCHIMAPQYATWQHSSHREVANCNDCHVPHDYVANKYYFKAKDGLRHATVFTLRAEPDVIFIKEEGKNVVINNCMRCHSELFDHGIFSQTKTKQKPVENTRACWDCHRETPHGRVNSISSVPHARVPLPESPVPNWLKQKMNKTN